MTEDLAPPPSILDGRRYSPVWLVPIAAVLFGAWIVIGQFAERGTEITIQFETAEGIEAGETKILARNVQVGTVTDIRLNDDLESVTVVALIDQDARRLLTEDTQFWVVRPRLDAGGISGLGTVLSGAYIELEHGRSEDRAYKFQGLEEAPVRRGNKPGVRISLVSSGLPMMQVGQAIRYQGMIVGRIETMSFDPRTRSASYSAYVEAPYDSLITSETRFWRTDAVDFNTSVDGIKLSVASLDSLFSGGITFGVPNEAPIDASAKPKTSYRIFPSEKAALEPQFRQSAEFVVLINSNIRGLKQGAPVLFQGIKVGSVRSTGQLGSGGFSLVSHQGVPVKIAIEPGRFGLSDDDAGVRRVRSEMDEALRQGLVARLETGNLITGSSLISLDFRGAPQGLRSFGGLRRVPLVRGDMAQLPVRANAVLAKLENLPLEKTLNQATSSLENISLLTKRLEALVANQETQAIPANVNRTLAEAEAALAGLSPESEAYQELNRTLNELRQTLEALQPVLRKLDERPEALIFGADDQADIQPTRKED